MTNKELRERAGLSAAEVAVMIGKTKKTIYLWEIKESYPKSLIMALKARIVNHTDELQGLENMIIETRQYLKAMEEQLIKSYKKVLDDEYNRKKAEIQRDQGVQS